jgi:hypothetical protein
MKTSIKIPIPSFLIALMLGLACIIGLVPSAQAVSPAPDGGYPGGNTAEGQNALFSLTSGGYNTAGGFFSLRNDTTGSFNTGFGAGALFSNNADQNCAFGVLALFSNTGPGNSAFGYSALMSNTANANAAFGAYSLSSNTTGNFNTASGFSALQNNTTGVQNTANGSGALLLNTTGDYNTAMGVNALLNNVGGENTAIGYTALFLNTISSGNTAIGSQALRNNTLGALNTANGYFALHQNTTGIGNTALGAEAGTAVTTANDVICIGSQGANVDNTTWISNIYETATVSGTTLPVVVSDGGQLGTTPSSRRFKKEIRPMDKASEAILALKPVTFRYKNDKSGASQFGLIAEEVDKVNPDLVVQDKEGKPYTVRYDQVNAMLLNEFLKEHRKTEKLETTVAQQQKQIDALNAGLQKVSTQLELNQLAPKTVSNNH